MKVNWANPPSEILYKILEQFKEDSKTLIQLQLTCKNWQLLAQAVMYKAIRLPPAEDPKSSLLIESLRLPDKDYASKVMELRFSSYSTLDRNNLVQIIRLCPNVKCVEHVVNKNIGSYYPLLLELYSQGYLRDLEKVGAPELKPQDLSNNNNKTKDYIHLMLELKESAKQLYVPFNHTRDGSVSLIPALKEFKRLEEIILGVSGGISFTQLGQILCDKHPLLKKVAVRAVGFTPNGQDDTPIMTALPHIRVLNLNLKTYSTEDLQLVQLMFPALQELYIGTFLSSSVYFDNLAHNDDKAKEEIKAFFGFVSRTKTFDIGFSSLRTTNSLEHLLCFASKQLRISSVAINVTRNGRHSAFNVSTSYEGYRGQQATLNKEGKVVCSVQITMPFHQVSENACQSLLKVLAEDINPCSIEIEDYVDNRMGSTLDSYRTVFGNHIDYMLTQFKDLKTLKLSNMSLAMEASASPAVAKPLELEELEILKCKVPALFFEQLSQKINSIKTLNIGLIIVESAILKGLSMPHTRLQVLRLDKSFKSCKLSISLNAASAHIFIDAYGFLKPATYYSNGGVSIFLLRCLSLSELKTTHHRMLLRSNNGRIDVFQQIKFKS